MLRIGRAATVALYDELALAPKPGLVSFADSGSHADMDARTFLRSLFALRHYFVQIATLGWRHAPFAALEACGIAAEARMLAATGGANTHRGAVFTLGLLCAAAGAALRDGPPALSPAVLRGRLQRHWGTALAARSGRPTGLPGSIAARRHGLRSASQEAAAGFPTLFEQVVPALAAGMRRGLTAEQARRDALFQAMAVLDDTNLVHRGGIAGLRDAQQAARDYLAAGGAARPGGAEAAWSLHRAFVARRLSPGGAADMLAAACWVVRVCDGA
ncbi:triphosphoribosyl-dephospho-CoA synthase MdcB [Xylophilus sp. Leaf220]|nr:triphosphoribosyl-dephospho-CoA synthase MdcB [Xylophilus sp. Leaf220]